MILTSIQNPKVKQLKKLMTDKSYVFFDNPKILQEAKQAGHKIICVLIKENTPYKTDYGGELIILSENVFKIFSTTENSQGVIGVVKFELEQLKPPQNNFLVLDNLQDPGNVGTLIRSALGANFLDIYLLDCVKVNNEKVVRSSMGAVFKTNVYQTTQNEFIKFFSSLKTNLAICDMNGQDVFKYDIPSPIGVVVGNEGNGVSQELRDIANITLKIPMLNNLESLNAGVSGSIIMYQIANKK